jgi:hypothetical protein
MRHYSEQELNQIAEAEQELDTKHGLILLDNSPTAKANALVLNEYSNNHNMPMTVSSMVTAAYTLRDKLDWKSPAQVEFSEVLARLEPTQCVAVNSWFKKQFRLKTDGDEGFRNLNQIISWLLDRRYAVTESGLDMALTNVQNNSSRKLFWREGRKQDRAIWNGKLNHARLPNTDQPKRIEVPQEFHANGRRNHAFKSNAEEPSKREPKVDAWKEIADLYLRRWTTHGQQAILQAEYDRGIATGKSWREIVAALGRIVKSWERGR